jgi:uncharacterized protein
VVRVLLVAAVVAAELAVPATAGVDRSASVGVYRLGDGRFVSLVESDGRLRIVDYRTGALRSLEQVSPRLAVGGPGVSVLEPVRVRVELAGSRRIRVDGSVGTRVPLVTQDVDLEDGRIRLAGRVLRPPGGGPFPAVVIVPGSVAARRTTYDLWAYFFAAQGFAVLSYDKRGVGSSGGTFERKPTMANLRALAADALAGVEWLRRQPFVDRSRVGLTGGSQAGWVIEMAAARSPAVRFAALQSSPAMSVGRQLAYDRLTRDGWVDPPPSDERITAALAGVPDSGYDPRPDLASLHIPVLWQLGAVDKRMNTKETVAIVRRLARAGSHDFTVRVYPGGAHSLRRTASGLISEERTSPGFVQGVFRDLAAWLRTHVHARRTAAP